MREIDAPALVDLRRILDLSGRSGTGPVSFDDDHLQQVFDVQKIIRRGLSIRPSSGIFGGQIVNTHPGIDDQTNTVDVYNLLQGATCEPPFPGPISESFDVWMVGGIRLQVDTLANFGDAVIDLVLPGIRAFPLAAGAGAIPLQAWLSALPVGGHGNWGADAIGIQFPQFAVRIPRNALIRFRSTTIIGLAVINVQFQLAVLTAGLGQDAVGAG